MKIVFSEDRLGDIAAVQVASFQGGEGVFRWFQSPSSSNFFDVFFDLVKNASTAEVISEMDPLGTSQIRIWYDGSTQFVNPPQMLPHPHADQNRYIGQFSWFLSSIGMSLKNPRTQSSSPISYREKKRWAPAMKVFRSSKQIPGELCISPEEWEVLRILDENPLLYGDAEFKEWARSRSG